MLFFAPDEYLATLLISWPIIPKKCVNPQYANYLQIIISILGKFTLDGNPSKKYLHDIALRDSGSSEEFYDKIHLLFLELLNFNKSENELVTALDKWVFALKYMSELTEIPETFTEEIFIDFFKTAEILTDMERPVEEIQQKIEWDHYAILQTAERKGKLEGILLVASNLIKQGLSLDTIKAATNLSNQELEKL